MSCFLTFWALGRNKPRLDGSSDLKYSERSFWFGSHAPGWGCQRGGSRGPGETAAGLGVRVSRALIASLGGLPGPAPGSQASPGHWPVLNPSHHWEFSGDLHGKNRGAGGRAGGGNGCIKNNEAALNGHGFRGECEPSRGFILKYTFFSILSLFNLFCWS